MYRSCIRFPIGAGVQVCGHQEQLAKGRVVKKLSYSPWPKNSLIGDVFGLIVMNDNARYPNAAGRGVRAYEVTVNLTRNDRYPPRLGKTPEGG